MLKTFRCDGGMFLWWQVEMIFVLDKINDADEFQIANDTENDRNYVDEFSL